MYLIYCIIDNIIIVGELGRRITYTFFEAPFPNFVLNDQKSFIIVTLGVSTRNNYMHFTIRMESA